MSLSQMAVNALISVLQKNPALLEQVIEALLQKLLTDLKA